MWHSLVKHYCSLTKILRSNKKTFAITLKNIELPPKTLHMLTKHLRLLTIVLSSLNFKKHLSMLTRVLFSFAKRCKGKCKYLVRMQMFYELKEILYFRLWMQYFCKRTHMFWEQTQSLLSECNTFLANANVLWANAKFLWGTQYFCKRMQMFCGWMQSLLGQQFFCKWTKSFFGGGGHNTSANECKWLERLQSFLRERKCFVGESKCFMQMFYKQTQSSSGKCITFSRERKCFAKECSQECFSGEHLCFASDRKVSWGNNIFARKSKSICHPISFFPITMFPSGLCKPTPSVNFLWMWIYFFPMSPALLFRSYEQLLAITYCLLSLQNIYFCCMRKKNVMIYSKYLENTSWIATL